MTKTNKTLLCALLALVLTLACALTIMPIAARAAEKTVTFDFTAEGYSDKDEVASKIIIPITIAFDKGSSNNAPKYYTTGTAIRAYAGNTITVSVDGGIISSIAFTFGSGEKANKIISSNGTFTTNKWTGKESSVVFTIDGTSGHRRIQKMAVTYTETEEHTHATTDSWIHMVATNENATCQNPGHGEYYTCDKCEGKYFVLTAGALTETTAEVLFTTVDHKYTYTANNDGTHKVGCENCDYAVANEACTYNEENKCEKCGAEKPAVPSYKKVTEAPADWSGTYVLVYENSGTEAYVWTGVDAVNCFTKATIENGKISGEFVTLTIAALDNGYSILLNGGTNNGKYVYRSSSSNGLNIDGTQGLNTISINGNAVEIVSNETTLKFNKNSDQLRFRYFAKGQQPVQLYKLVPGDHEHVEGDGIVTKAATCKENGEMTYKCTICGEVVRTDVIAKTTEHSYNDGEITTAATCTATGVKTFTCTVCGETKTEEIEALGHDFHGEEIVVPATCVKTGTKLVECTRCTATEETELPIDENAHKWGEAAHIEGTETHKFTCEYDPTHTKIENCTYDGGLCSECLAEKPATEDKFTIVESIAAGENTVEKDGVLYVKAGSRVIVTYTITANSGVDVIEATLKQNAKFTFVSMTAGTLNNASATVTGTDVESAVKKIVVTAEKGGFTQSNVVLMTVVYELATGVAENEIPEFGIELTVLNGNTELAADKVTFTAHQTKFAVRSSELPAITVNGKTSSEEIHLTYKGEAYTSSDFAIAGRTDTPTIQWTDVANAGNYTFTLKFADNGTYGEQTVTFTVVIDKVALKASDFEIKLAEGASLTKKLVSGSVSWSKADFAVTIADGKLVGSDTLATIGGLDGTDCTLTEARSQTLTVEFVLLSDNYTLDGKVSKQFTLTAEKTDLTFGGIAIADNASKYYDGNTENVGTITVSDGNNVIEAVVNVTITKDGAAVNEILHAGKYVKSPLQLH